MNQKIKEKMEILKLLKEYYVEYLKMVNLKLHLRDLNLLNHLWVRVRFK